MQNISKQLHEQALTASRNFRKAENELIDVLQKIDLHRSYLEFGFPNLFKYAVEALELSEANAYSFISVARKAKEVPALKTEIEKGNLSLSKAKKIVPVLTKENQSVWLSKAATLSKSELEKQVAKEKPEVLRRETTRRVTEDRVSMHLHVSEDLMRKLRRVQTLLINKKRKSQNLEETLNALVESYLDRNDPLRKNEMARNKNGSRDRLPVGKILSPLGFTYLAKQKRN